MNKKILKLLYRSFDDDLSLEDHHRLDDALAKSAELRAEKERLLAMRAMVSDSGANSFQPFFAEKVMRRIRNAESAQESFLDSLIAVFRPVAIAAFIILVMLISYNLKKTENYTLAGALGEHKATLEEIVDPIYMFTAER